MDQRTVDEIQIVTFIPEFAADFGRLNYEWIEKYFSVERHDREILDHPQEYVLDQGGQIYMALAGEDVVGVVALIPASDGVLELTKMAVSPKLQGRGIANQLMQACLDHARKQNSQLIFLESHRSLRPAINLYRKFGFVETPLDPNSEYDRADIRMEIALDPADQLDRK